MRYDYDVMIIGSGAAGYATADRLHNCGIDNICVFTESRTAGTSRNAGSDKQTYYKLDVSPDSNDSVRKMAADLFAGGSMNGSDAYLEAVNSIRCFMYLVESGVPFPHDEFGVYHGYRTDHDNTKRATSAGPLTSRYMTEVIEKRVVESGTEIRDGYQAVKLIVRDGRCYGAYFIHDNKPVAFYSKAVVLCTGAPAEIYADSVYPIGHRGATGLAIEAGALLQNFQEWQYGIASKEFRWNLSGSYQQVIPAYISVSPDGTEREFLSEIGGALSKVFRKGYEWPFDSRKISGSSEVDMLVAKEISAGNRVYLDYRVNPAGFSFSKLDNDAREYLERADVNAETPYGRLVQLNPAAARLYYDNGINLQKERLEIGVCAQHNNGGIKVDLNGETTVKNLFCAGEASGRFGVYRPGGAALNDTQVGALVIAEYLRKHIQEEREDTISISCDFVLPELGAESNVDEINSSYARRMSDCAANVRCYEKVKDLLEELEAFASGYGTKVRISSADEYSKYYSLYLTTLARISLCMTILSSADKCGSRGGCICTKNGIVMPENTEYRKMLTITGKEVSFISADEVPVYDCVFEKLLKNFRG